MLTLLARVDANAEIGIGHDAGDGGKRRTGILKATGEKLIPRRTGNLAGGRVAGKYAQRIGR